jgi:acyl carrier protein
LREELRTLLAAWTAALAGEFTDDTSLIASGALDSLGLFNLTLWIEAKTGRPVDPTRVDPASGSGGWANLGTQAGEALGVHIINAWTSSNGLTLWMTYSAGGKAPPGALFPPEGTALDSFNLVSARLIPGARTEREP